MGKNDPAPQAAPASSAPAPSKIARDNGARGSETLERTNQLELMLPVTQAHLHNKYTCLRSEADRYDQQGR